MLTCRRSGVDVERLRTDRLGRLQGIMRARGLSALLLTDPLNIRYATNTVLWLNLRATGGAALRARTVGRRAGGV